MHISVTYEKARKKIVLAAGATARDALEKMGVNPEMVLVKRGREIIPDAEKLNDGDKIELLRVVTGG